MSQTRTQNIWVFLVYEIKLNYNQFVLESVQKLDNTTKSIALSIVIYTYNIRSLFHKLGTQIQL